MTHAPTDIDELEPEEGITTDPRGSLAYDQLQELERLTTEAACTTRTERARDLAQLLHIKSLARIADALEVIGAELPRLGGRR